MTNINIGLELRGDKEPSTDRLSPVSKTSVVRIVLGLLEEATPIRSLDYPYQAVVRHPKSYPPPPHWGAWASTPTQQ